MDNCKICKSADLYIMVEKEPINYQNQTLYVEIESTRCNECGREFIHQEQIIRNDVRIRDAKEQCNTLRASNGKH